MLPLTLFFSLTFGYFPERPSKQRKQRSEGSLLQDPNNNKNSPDYRQSNWFLRLILREIVKICQAKDNDTQNDSQQRPRSAERCCVQS